MRRTVNQLIAILDNPEFYEVCTLTARGSEVTLAVKAVVAERLRIIWPSWISPSAASIARLSQSVASLVQYVGQDGNLL
jgi:hypothetical protein